MTTGLAALTRRGEISDQYVSDPSSHFTVGQSVVCQVIKIDSENGRVQVTLKASVCEKPTDTNKIAVSASRGVYVQSYFEDLQFIEDNSQVSLL